MFTMKKKDLAKEYTLARLQGRLSGNEMSFSENKIFTEEDIESAFNAGRDSVVENIPDLKWECEYPYTANETRTPITIFHIFHNDDGFHLTGYGLGLSKMFGTLDEAKRFANEEYKNRIKQALGLWV